MSEPTSIVLEGVVERIIHVGADGHTIALLTIGERETTAKIAGVVLVGLQPGETLRVSGRWATGARHAETFRVTECEHILPATIHAIRCYLGSGLIKGIGNSIAQSIVDHFGADTLDVIDNEPHRLLDVHLIGRARQAMILKG